VSAQDGELYEEWLDLKNGCLCCTVKSFQLPDKANSRDTGIIAIEKLMQKKGKFDYILLETTGLADPGPIAAMFWLDDSLGAGIYLDGIVTVIDCVNIDRSLSTHDKEHLSTAHFQISHADVILINKTDLVPEKDKAEVVDKVKSINSLAKIFETKYTRLKDLDEILDLHAYDSVNLPPHEFNRDSSGHLDHVRSCSTQAN